MKKALFIIITLVCLQQNFSQTPITATIPFQGYDEPQAYLGEGEYQIFLDNTNGVLDKPIIVIDGFDPNDGRDINGIYNTLNYDNTNIADQLRSEGFDFVFLNFPTYTRPSDGVEVNGGADFIQRNAMVLVELISEINSQKVGNEELMFIAPSMGGLVSRYALRYMEQNSMPHESSLYISWDAPHKGMNIPIEFQYLMNYIAEVNGGNADLQAVLASTFGSPASKQMMIDHFSAHLAGGSTFEQDNAILLPIGATNFRDAFQLELDAMGFPQQTRNVCLANGSSTGTMTGTPGMEILNHTFDVPDQPNLTIDIVLHFTPLANQNIEVTSAITYIEVFGTLVPLATFTANSQSFSFTDGLDSAAGGKVDLQSLLGAAQDNPILLELINNLQQSEFCFMPTISALAIDNENDWYASVDIPTTHNSPFVAWHIPTVNETHLVMSTTGANFVMTEIRNQIASINNASFGTMFKLSNNPVSTEINVITNTNYNKLNVSIVSVTGQNLVSKQFTNVTNKINLPINLSNGIYFLKIAMDNKSYVKKIVVNK